MSKRDHRYRHVTETVYRTPWAILPEKLDEILSVLDRRNTLPADDPVNVAAASNWMDDEEENDEEYAVNSQGVAVLSLSGVISQRMNMLSRFSGGTSTEQFTRTFQKAMADPNVRAVVLDVNSPGGSIGGVAELSNVIYQARGEKPICAVSNTQMASAAYWIGSAADTVIASPSSSTGSIGVYMVHSERSKLDAAVGVSRSIIKAGKFKTIGNDVEPLTKESKAKLQEFVDAAYGLFIEAVARNRGTSASSVSRGYGEGDTLLASDAVRVGLADRVASLDEVVAELGSRLAGASPNGPLGNPATAKAAIQAPVLPVKGVQKMDKRIVAALFAKGLISEQDETLAAVALSSYFAGQCKPVPKDTDEVVAAIMAPHQVGVKAVETVKSEPVRVADATDAKEITAAERYRGSSIRASARLLGVEEVADELIASGVTVADAVPKLAEAAAGKNKVPVRPDKLDAGESVQEKFALACSEVLDARAMNAPVAKMSPPARELSGMRLMDLAAESLKVQGYDLRGLSRDHVAKMALAGPIGISQSGLYAGAVPTQAFYTTGNFSQLALSASHKTLQKSFLEAPVSYRQWVRQGDPVVDFKVQNIIKFGAASDLEMVPEGQDTPTDTGLTDAKEYFVVERFAKDIGFTFQMLLNDDLSALSRIPQLQGIAAARTFNKLVYALLNANPTMADGYSLFDATYHQSNLLSGTSEAPTVASLQKCQTVLRKMKGLNTDAILNLELRYLLVPVALEATAKALIWSSADPAGTHAGVANIYGRGNYTIDVVVEPLLDANSAAYFYGVADNAVIDTITVRFLQGQETPVMDSYWDPKKNTRFFQVSQTGAAVLEEYRGIVRDNGA